MLSEFSVKKPFTIFVGVILVIILGIISFTSMTTDLLPSMDLPYAVIVTQYIGASPEKIETIVTKPIEQSMGTVSNIKKVSSTSSENASMVVLQFSEEANMDSIMIEIDSKLDMLKANWEDEIGSPMVMKLNPDMLPIMMSTVDIQGMDNSEITKMVKDTILPELEKIEGVASVNAVGLIEDQIKISLSQEKIDAINDKVLGNINSKLANTKSKLDTAKNQINQGKVTLEKQISSQKGEIEEGLNAVEKGLTEITIAENEIQEKEKTLSSSKAILVQTIESLNETYNKLNKEKEELLSKDNLTPEEQSKLDTIKSSMEKIVAEKETLNSKLTEVNQALDTVAEGKTSIENQKTGLQEKQNQLQQAKETLNSEYTKANEKLNSSETELNQGLKEFESARAQAYEKASIDGMITEDMISNILTAENFSMPAGYVDTNQNTMIVKVGEKFNNIEEVKNLTLFSMDIPGLENITLGDVADIKMVNNSEDIYAKVNQNNGIVLSFEKQSTASTAEVCKKIEDTMQQLQDKYTNIRFTNLMNQGDYIKIIINSVLQNLIYGGILAIIVLFIFLKDYKPTLIVALSIPISLTFAITLMYFSGVTINIISLSGLALAVGMLVDNSIVVIENIYRLRNQGMSIKEAAVKGAMKVAGAIFASTLTTICVFLPIVFIQGISRQLFTDMGLTIAYSLLASLLVALTLVPAIASGIFKNMKPKEHKWFEKLVGVYGKTLKKALKLKPIVLIGCVVLLVLSGFLATRMGTAFMPKMESNEMSLTLTMSKESSFTDLKNTSDTVINRLLEIEDIQTIGAIEESALGMMSGSTNNNTVSMYLLLKEDKKSTDKEIEKQIYQKTEDLNCEVDVSTSNMDMSAMSGTGISVMIKGENLDKLQEIAKEVSNLLNQTEGVTDVENGIGETSKEMRIIVDKNKAMGYGLTVAGIYSEVAKSIQSENKATTITIDKKDYPVVVVKAEDKRITNETLSNISLKGTKNQEEIIVPLKEIAEISQANSMNAISHDNQERYIQVSASIDTDHNIGLVSREFQSKLKDYTVPQRYTVKLAGENETINESLVDLVKMVLLAILFIYLIMVAQFQSLLSPFIIMFTIPLAFTGGLFALFITGTEISVIAMLGFLVLAGVVVNNGIVFVDYVNQLRKEGVDRKEALVIAGKTRIRPILMTAFTTILGLLTMALGIGTGADMVQPLGIVTIGGLTYSTLLTLYVVPCLYDIFCKKKVKG